MKISPSATVTQRERELSSVVLPQPLGTMIPTISPASTPRSILLRASTRSCPLWSIFRTCFACIIVCCSCITVVLFTLLGSWLKRPFRHVQNAQPGAERIFYDSALPYRNIKRLDKYFARMRCQVLHSRNHVVYQVVNFYPLLDIRVAVNYNLAIRSRENEACRSLIPPDWPQAEYVAVVGHRRFHHKAARRPQRFTPGEETPPFLVHTHSRLSCAMEHNSAHESLQPSQRDALSV